MGNHYASDYNQKPLHMAAYGNAWTEDYAFTGAPAAADKVYLGIIPAGTRVQALTLQHPAAGVSAQAKLGFEPAEGDDPAADDGYWLPAATDVADAGVKASTAAPITFNKPVKLVLTAAGAAFTSGTWRVIVTGKVIGVR